MPIASILLIVYMGYILLAGGSSKEKYLSFLVLATLMAIAMPQGYLLKIGDTEISSLRKLSGLVCFLYGLYYILIHRLRLSQKIIVRSGLLLGSLMVGILVAIVYPYTEPIIPPLPDYSWDLYTIGECTKIVAPLEIGNALRLYLGVVMFLGVVASVKVICNDDDLTTVLRKVIVYSQPLAYYGIFEFVEKNILGDLTLTFDINEIVFGVGESTFIHAFTKGGDLYVLQGVTKESSHFILSMFILALSILVWNKIQKVHFHRDGFSFYHVYLLLLIALMVLSGGFSAWWCIFILLLIYFALRYDIYKKTLRESVPYIITALMFVLSVLGGILFFFGEEMEYAIARAEDVFYTINILAASGTLAAVGAEGELSTFSRLTSIFDVTASVIDRPLLGLGIGFQFALAALPTMLSDLGLLGLVFWFRVMSVSVGDVRQKYDLVFLSLFVIVWGAFFGVVTLYVELYILVLFECTRLYATR